MNDLILFEGSEHFKPEELWSPDIKKAYVVPEFIDMLEELRNEVGFPLIVSSGYRTPEYNKKIGGSPQSYHTKGMAVDLAVAYREAYDVIEAAMKVGFGGIGIQQKLGTDATKRFIHLDIRLKKLRTIWSY